MYTKNSKKGWNMNYINQTDPLLHIVIVYSSRAKEYDF